MAEFQALPAIRLMVSASAELEPVNVQLPGAYIVLPPSEGPEGGAATYPGSGDYEAATVNATLTALIDRKLERSAVTGMRNLVVFFENKLA